jgi:hypothetical protein
MPNLPDCAPGSCNKEGHPQADAPRGPAARARQARPAARSRAAAWRIALTRPKAAFRAVWNARVKVTEARRRAL